MKIQFSNKCNFDLLNGIYLFLLSLSIYIILLNPQKCNEF